MYLTPSCATTNISRWPYSRLKLKASLRFIPDTTKMVSPNWRSSRSVHWPSSVCMPFILSAMYVSQGSSLKLPSNIVGGAHHVYRLSATGKPIEESGTRFLPCQAYHHAGGRIERDVFAGVRKIPDSAIMLRSCICLAWPAHHGCCRILHIKKRFLRCPILGDGRRAVCLVAAFRIRQLCDEKTHSLE